MLRLQLATIAFSALAALVPGMFNPGGDEPTKKAPAGHFTSAPMQSGGLVSDDTPKAEVAKDFKAPGFKAEESWGEVVDRRLDELERKVALCPCSNGTSKPAPAATATTKEAVVRSDMKPQEVVDTLTKLGFKSTAPAPVVSTVVSSGGSTGSYSGGSTGSSAVLAGPVVTTWETSAYATPAPVYSGPTYSYSVPAYQPMRPLQNARAYRSSGTCRIVNGQMVCGGY